MKSWMIKLIGLIIAIVGVYLLVKAAGAQTAIGVYLLMCANNLDHKKESRK